MNRETVKKSDVLMFFDYPASQEIFNDILKSAAPKFLHFMNYEPQKIDEKEFLRTLLRNA